MKNKFIFISALFLVFLLYIFCSSIGSKPKSHKVLDVIRADMFYVDINDNSKIDEGELFKLKDIYAFSDETSDFVAEHSEKLNMSAIDYLKAGFIAQNWALDNLKGENITITSVIKDNSKNYSYITADFKGYDLSRFYLEHGLAFSNNNSQSDYPIFQNLKQTKNNIEEISKLDFVLVNLKSKIFHKLNCEHIDLIHRAKLIPFKNAKNYIPCKNCFNKIDVSSIIIPSSSKVHMNKDFGDFELYFTNPLIYKKPDNTCSNEICKRLVKEIDNTKTSLDIAIYGLGNIPKIYEALKNAKERGVKIRAVVDYSKNMDELYPKTADFIRDFGAVCDKTEVIMHNKFLIFDNKKVLTGSANISPSGIGGYSANSVAIVNLPKIVARYEEEFEQMYNSKFSIRKDKFDIAQENNVSVYFSPKDSIKDTILKEINSSKDEICISAFYLTNREIINAIIGAKQRGVSVFIILDAVSANNFKDRVYLMRKSGINLIVENWGGKDHEKTILIDKKTLMMGSLNFSSAGLNKNDENMLLIKNKEACEFYRNYFFYLFNSIDKKFLKFIPRSEGKESVNSCSDGVDNNFDGNIDYEDEGCRNVN